NSMGGYLALLLAARGRADTVTALAPAGGWSRGEPVAEEALRLTERIRSGARGAAAQADAVAATPEGRRRAMSMIVSDGSDLPADLVAHMIRATAGASGFEALTASARRDGWPLDAAAIRCPVRVLWGTADRLLPWPAAAESLRRALPQAEWVELDGVGHHPQLEVPLETAELILGLSRYPARMRAITRDMRDSARPEGDDPAGATPNPA
ncbi:MAG TPA: alpha/beta hydrolase, partial [Miltoncostaea sp.]|nr:alpha/beta hydrolase [Miltoncostaea sp.]